MKIVKSGPVAGFRLSTLAIVVAFTSPLTLAQDAGWYGGFGLGEAKAEFEADAIVSALNAAGSNTTAITREDRELAGKIFAGYDFNRYFGLEGSYFYLGNFGLNASVQPLARAAGDFDVEGLGLDLVGKLPLVGGLSAFARAGLHYAWVDESFSGPGVSFSRNDKDGSHKYGLGMQYDFSDAFALRLEKERYELDDTIGLEDSVDLVTLGFVFRFGSRPAPAPAPVAAAPQPTPAPQPAPPTPPPPPPEPVRITLSADALFDFDSAELRPAGRQDLDVLMEDLRGLEYEVINVTGHTDRLGPPDYNLELSQQRADTVRNYMIGSGIPAGDITARGINGDAPVMSAQQCQGPVTAEVIACLQPDRRVEVEVSALRVPE